MMSVVGDTVISAALPLTGTDLLATPFTLNFTDPFRSPPAVGWKVTVAVQFCPANSVGGQFWVIGKSARDDVTVETVIGAKPMLLSIVVSAGLATPTNSVGKLRLAGMTAETAMPLDSVMATAACGRLKLPMPLPAEPNTI